MNKAIFAPFALVFGFAVAFCLDNYVDIAPTIPETPQVERNIIEVIPEPPSPDQARETITQQELYENLHFLASDELEGRKPGTEGFRRAAEFVANEFSSYGLKPGAGDSYYQHFTMGGRKTYNVVGYFPGTDPQHKDEVIVVGAHLDHLGKSSRGIYNGADDNGSGVVTMLEIAEALGEIKDTLKRTIVFIAFSEEESGLNGSSFYVKHPTFPINKTVAMINYDMVGYLRNDSLSALGAGKTSSFLRIFDKHDDKYGLTIRPTNSGGGRSDHANFESRGVPVIFFHTGSHDYYHTVRDTVEKINYEGMTKVAKFSFDVILELDDAPQIQFVNHGVYKRN